MNQINTTICSSKLCGASNARSTFLKVPRSSCSSSSEDTPEEPSDQGKVPFGYTRKDVQLIVLGVTVLGVGLKYGFNAAFSTYFLASRLIYAVTVLFQFGGVDPLQADSVVELVMVMGLTVGWISTFLFRVSNKEMIYGRQLRDYENKVMQKRFEGLTEPELEALLELVEVETRRVAIGVQL